MILDSDPAPQGAGSEHDKYKRLSRNEEMRKEKRNEEMGNGNEKRNGEMSSQLAAACQV